MYTIFRKKELPFSCVFIKGFWDLYNLWHIFSSVILAICKVYEYLPCETQPYKKLQLNTAAIKLHFSQMVKYSYMHFIHCAYWFRDFTKQQGCSFQIYIYMQMSMLLQLPDGFVNRPLVTVFPIPAYCEQRNVRHQSYGIIYFDPHGFMIYQDTFLAISLCYNVYFISAI